MEYPPSQSSRVLVFPFFPSPVSFVSSDPVESALSIVPRESFVIILFTSSSVKVGGFASGVMGILSGIGC